MNKYMFSIFFIFIIMWSCSNEGNPVTNNYFNGDTTIIIDTTIIFDTTFVIGDTNSNDWGYDPLICGTDLDNMFGLRWAIDDIKDGQDHICRENESYGDESTPLCAEYMGEFDYNNTSGLNLIREFYFKKNGELFKDQTQSYVTINGNSVSLLSWSTRNGNIRFEIADTSYTTDAFEYFFNGKEYSYSVDIYSNLLTIENHVSIIKFDNEYWDF